MTDTARAFHFLFGPPRSGSTLTSAILRQTPRFHAGMSSPIAGLFDGMIAQGSAGTESSTMVSQNQRARLPRGLFDSYDADYSQPVIFDTNRTCTAQPPALAQVFPDAKVISLVRDVSWIMNSMERQFRQSAFEHTRLFNRAAERSTVYRRLEALANGTRLSGYPWHALRQACYSEFADRIIVVKYDLLTQRLAELYNLLSTRSWARSRTTTTSRRTAAAIGRH